MPNPSEPREYRPELISRRGELIAWSSAILVAAGWLVLRQTQHPVMIAFPILLTLLVLAGLSISLGNWMDRHTLIRVKDSEIHFSNGLRNVTLNWQDIQQVRVLPTSWGDKVQVFGEKSYFEFRTLGEVKVQGEIKGRMGFLQGSMVLQQILANSGLQKQEHSGEGYYYGRS